VVALRLEREAQSEVRIKVAERSERREDDAHGRQNSAPRVRSTCEL
jgi:hypothetical protein